MATNCQSTLQPPVTLNTLAPDGQSTLYLSCNTQYFQLPNCQDPSTSKL